MHASPSLWQVFKRFALLCAMPGGAGSAAPDGFYEHDGVAIGGYDPVAYFTEQQALLGRAAFAATHEGSVFLFASAANRAQFLTAPARYTPQFGGYCAYGAAAGYKAKVDPQAFHIEGDKLYLNYDRRVQAKWLNDMAGAIERAEAQWPEVSRTTEVFD